MAATSAREGKVLGESTLSVGTGGSEPLEALATRHLRSGPRSKCGPSELVGKADRAASHLGLEGGRSLSTGADGASGRYRGHCDLCKVASPQRIQTVAISDCCD